MDHPMKIREALILAGGFGTRLQSVVSDIPKPMADINGKPFLEYLLSYLHAQGCRHCVLSTGYKHETILNYFGDQFRDMPLDYAVENEPLGTGGGIKNGTSLIVENNFFVLNGDSFFDVDLKKLQDYHFDKKAITTLSLKKMFNIDRYGTVDVVEGRVTSFNEKKFVEEGFINGGVYVMSKKIFDDYSLGERFSLEKDIFEKKVSECPIFALDFDGYFIDFGIPEDYERAKRELPPPTP